MALVVKNTSANAADVRDASLIPGLEDPLEEGMETHSNILAWRILWTEGPVATAHSLKESDTTEAT